MNEILAVGGWILWGLLITGFVIVRSKSIKLFAKKNDTEKNNDRRETLTAELIRDHFHPDSLENVTISERRFPFRVRADLQRAIDQLFEDHTTIAHFCGVKKDYSYDEFTLSDCLIFDRHRAAVTVPPQYEEVDIGEQSAVRCLKNGLWLLQRGDQRYVVLLSQTSRYRHKTGMQFQIAAQNCPAGTEIAQEFFRFLEDAVSKAGSYRGKILSLELDEDSYSGESTGISVHKLRTVTRDQVILPAETLDLLDRNVIEFSRQRAQLSQRGLSTKKGILFYGPPGTGKTHTIHYLAEALREHTILLITAEQVALLREYFTLARLLQPSVVVIEDADLIAHNREEMGTCEQVMLNRLLNEMDGLKEDADVLFILTTNRPESLERALASRPGRIDQAIEFPFPDDEGRAKLVELYAAGMKLSDEITEHIVQRTDGVSAAFIKELMRRSLQFHLEQNGSGSITPTDIDSALDEMLLRGGKLNQRLLGADSIRDRAVGFR